MSETKFTPGPWSWYGSTDHTPRVYLATTYSGRNLVMGFRRAGMQGAEPVFRAGGRMVPASEFVRFDVDRSVMGKAAGDLAPSVYRQDFSEIDHPDARLIANAPALYEALERIVEARVGESVRFAEDTDADYFLRMIREIKNEARSALAQARGERP